MTKKLFVTVLLTLVSTTAFAQDNELSHNDVSFSAGAGVPTGSDTAYLNNAPMISLTYGYRFTRLFQAESGFQMAFGAANNQNPEASQLGTVQGGDHEFMLPITGRVYIPLPFDKWQLSGGGGLMYLHYGETASSNAGACFTCTTRGGWGYHGLLSVRYLLNDNFYVGTTLQYVTGTLNGDAVGNTPGTKTTDHWVNALVGIGLTF